MQRIRTFVDHPLAVLGCFAILAMMTLTAVSSLGRAIFSRPIPDIVTIDEMLMALVVFLPLAYVQLNREHVEVTIFTDWLPPRALTVLRAFSLTVSTLAWGFLCWALTMGAWKAWVQNDVYLGEMVIPSWGTRAVAALGVAFFVVRLLVDLKREINPRASTDEAYIGDSSGERAGL